MRTQWTEAEETAGMDKAGELKQVVSPVSLIITAFAPVEDVRRTLTPELRRDAEVGETELLLIDLGEGCNRLGGSALAQVYGVSGDMAPDVDPGLLKAFFNAIQQLNRDGKILAYHDRSDGGLWATICEMSFAAHVGISLNSDALCFDALMNDVDGMERRPDMLSGRTQDKLLAALFTEELGAVLQIRHADRSAVMDVLREAELSRVVHFIGHTNTSDEVRVWRNAKRVFSAPRHELQRVWSEVSFQIAQLRDDATCAKEEFSALLDREDPGLSAKTTFELEVPFETPFIASGTRPKIAILREQGVNGHVEMAAAFDRAGFATFDVHMSDLQVGRVKLADFKGLVACGGFSYGDVLGAGQGWAKSILFNNQLRDEFATFFARTDSFSLGVCNGCQMMAHLAAIIPGADNWPTFQRNRSEQFEARLVMVEIPPSPSIFMAGMAGSQLPVVVSHGEGRAAHADHEKSALVTRQLQALRYIDHRGAVASVYPFNPNGSPEGLAGVTSTDGRVTIMMPHPERVVRAVQMSWHPRDWEARYAGASPWMNLFHNARRWLK